MPGNWIYLTPRKEEIRVQCPNYNKPFEIENSGIITIQKGCKIRATTAVMSHPSVQLIKISQHYTPHSNFSILNLYKPTQREYEINLTDTTRELWISNNSNIEATFEDIIQKARQIKERKFRERWVTMYSATACGIGILGTFTIIIFLAYQNSRIRTVTDTFINKCCTKNKENKEPTPHPSIENKRADEGTRHEQSSLSSEAINATIHKENEEEDQTKA